MCDTERLMDKNILQSSQIMVQSKTNCNRNISPSIHSRETHQTTNISILGQIGMLAKYDYLC